MHCSSHPENQPPTGRSSRRQFLARTGVGLLTGLACRDVQGTEAARRWTWDLTPGAVGVSGRLDDLIPVAARHGFESLAPDAPALARMDADRRRRIVARLESAGLRWGSAGLPVDFRGDEAAFDRDLAQLPSAAQALADVGGRRMNTWLMPGHATLTRTENLDLHARRLGRVAAVLGDHGIRLGLEYVGTPSLRTRFSHPFVHSLPGARELIRAIGRDNVGLVLDSWHWWTAGDTAAGLDALRNADVVAVDLNDAPAGVALADQQDGRRELPAATGVIPVADFLRALLRMGYDGPVRAEPFNAPLNQLDNDPACTRVITALRAAGRLAGV